MSCRRPKNNRRSTTNRPTTQRHTCKDLLSIVLTISFCCSIPDEHRYQIADWLSNDFGKRIDGHITRSRCLFMVGPTQHGILIDFFDRHSCMMYIREALHCDRFQVKSTQKESCVLSIVICSVKEVSSPFACWFSMWIRMGAHQLICCHRQRFSLFFLLSLAFRLIIYCPATASVFWSFLISDHTGEWCLSGKQNKVEINRQHVHG